METGGAPFGRPPFLLPQAPRHSAKIARAAGPAGTTSGGVPPTVTLTAPCPPNVLATSRAISPDGTSARQNPCVPSRIAGTDAAAPLPVKLSVPVAPTGAAKLRVNANRFLLPAARHWIEIAGSPRGGPNNAT